MNRKYSLQRICAAAMLIAVGIIIPMFSPLKILLEPASFTLASHVAIFIAMFISLPVAAAVAAGTAAGFLLGGFPIAIVLRAATHIIFASLGAFYIQKNPRISENPVGIRIFSLVIGLIHGACEVAAISFLYFYGQMGASYYQSGFLRSVLLLVGAGSVIHSMIDFEIALVIVKILKKQKGFEFFAK